MNTIKVQLCAATIPGFPGIFADHYWLVVLRGIEGMPPQTCDRWEVWQHSSLNDSCWGHLHKNLLDPYQGVGHGPSRVIEQWVADEASCLIQKIESSPSTYPFLEEYRYWPGPNSNTFAQWVVRETTELGRRAIGRNFPVPEIIR